MTARDHLTVARRQLDGADRRLVDGRTKDADGCLAGLIAEAAKARLQLAYDRGREDERADAETQAQLDLHVRVMRGRDAIAHTLAADLGWRAYDAIERANNYAQVLSDAGAADTADLLAMVGATTTPDRRLQVLAHVLCAWARTERETPTDELADIDAEGPCRAGDEERAPEQPDTAPPPAPVSPTAADLVRLGALFTRASEHVRSERAGDAP